ncbi:hypothetical protein FF1_038257 [Malus domestica]
MGMGRGIGRGMGRGKDIVSNSQPTPQVQMRVRRLRRLDDVSDHQRPQLVRMVCDGDGVCGSEPPQVGEAGGAWDLVVVVETGVVDTTIGAAGEDRGLAGKFPI